MRARVEFVPKSNPIEHRLGMNISVPISKKGMA